jgi:hypothetical protein
MTLALYPVSPVPLSNGYSVTPIFETQTTPMRSGADVTYARFTYPRHSISMNYRAEGTDADDVLDFFEARAGKFEAFDFIDFVSRSWEGFYVGIGDGAEDTWDLPFATGAAVSVYVNGVLKTVITDYTYGAATDPNGRIELIFNRAVGNGRVITIDFTGKRYFVA